MPRLENFAFVFRRVDLYECPELSYQKLSGNVYDHALHDDGKFIITSKLIGKRGNKVVTLTGTEYELGAPEEEYEKLYPDSKSRLLKVLPELA